MLDQPPNAAENGHAEEKDDLRTLKGLMSAFSIKIGDLVSHWGFSDRKNESKHEQTATGHPPSQLYQKHGIIL